MMKTSPVIFKKHLLRRFFCPLGAIGILLLGLERLYAFQHGGFSLQKSLSFLPCNTDAIVEPIPEEVLSLLKQPFYFLGSGGTSFAFLGKDKKTVLKLFKHQHFTTRSWKLHIALPPPLEALKIFSIIQKETQHRHKRLPFFFASCDLAWNILKQETGLIYLTLQKHPCSFFPVTLIDRWGFQHVLDVNQTEFALQHYAVPLFDALMQALRQGQIQKCKNILSSLLEQMTTRIQHRICDRDLNLHSNYGVVCERVIEVDVGSFSLNREPIPSFYELNAATLPLQNWLAKQSPELLDYLQQQLRHAKVANSCVR